MLFLKVQFYDKYVWPHVFMPFLHLLNIVYWIPRTRRKPMTILVINNHGGAIFSLLPIADGTPASILDQYFYTSHDVSVRKLCSAHRYLWVVNMPCFSLADKRKFLRNESCWTCILTKLMVSQASNIKIVDDGVIC